MSRRGQSRAGGSRAHANVAQANNTLEDADITDPVIGVIRFGMDNIMKIAHETIPYCSADDEDFKNEVKEKMETSLLQLVEAEITYSQTSTIVNQVVDELAFQDNPDMDAKEFADSVDSINDLVNQRMVEYKATLTEDVLKSHATYIQMKEQMETLLSRMELGSAIDTADAETEAEEVDLDDSTVGDDDGEAHEVIPELDPISKQPLMDPVRNNICRHIYGKATMLQLIKKNPKTRCPAMGCDNPQFVKAAHLMDDPYLTSKVTGQPPPSKAPKSGRGSASPNKAKRGRRRR